MQTLNLISKSYNRQESFKIEGRGYYAPITSLCSDLNEIYGDLE